MPKVVAEDGRRRKHRHFLQNLLETTKGPVRIASAYITDTDMLFGIENREVQVLTCLSPMDILSGATSLESVNSLIQTGVKCRDLSGGPKLHAKVYMFGNEVAFVTSANLTRSGLDSNIEVGVQLAGSAVRELTVWFDTFWKKAKRLDVAKIAEWKQETAALRREFAALRKKVRKILTSTNEASPSVPSPQRLHDLLNDANCFFVCNTDRKHDLDAEDRMRRRNYAAAWETFKYVKHMEKVKKGHAIFMFAKGEGIIGVGRAKAPCEKLRPDDPDRVRETTTREWRIPVDWLAWEEHDADAVSFDSPNATFFDVSGDTYRDLRRDVRSHFLGDS